MSERTIVITGASNGIGEAAARRLRDEGAQVIVVGRSPEKTAKVADDLDAAYYVADFTKLDDVRTLAAALRADVARIDVLANNAGGVMGAPQLTVDGNEMTFQVNHLAPFLLTNLLLDTLTNSHASVITTSSLAHRGAGTLDLHDLSPGQRYTPQSAYAKTKLMNILFTLELDRRFRASGIAAAAFHPGIVRTSFAAEFPGRMTFAYTSALRHLLRSPERGADTLVWLATSQPDVDWRPGGYYKNRKSSRRSAQASDSRLAGDLWDLSAQLTNLT
jgi:NAD(P)-dependent dehydrogenase (short-subunit alcohol dehydrogenase family)